MKDEHIILRVKRVSTKDVFSQSLPDAMLQPQLVNVLQPYAFPVGGIGRLGPQGAVAGIGGVGAQGAAGEIGGLALQGAAATAPDSTRPINNILPMTRASWGFPDTMPPFMLMPSTAEPVEEMAVEVRNIERSSIAELSRSPDVRAVAPTVPTMLIKAFGDDTEIALPPPQVAWGVMAVGAHTSPFTGAGITVAVLDTGIDRTHPAFQGINLIEKDFTDEGNGDLNGHGTHCAGVIFGRANGFGRIGVAHGVEKALIGKIIGSKGGSTKMAIDALEWAVQNGANVVSMSIGIDYGGIEQQMKDRNVPVEVAVARVKESYRATVKLFETMAAYIKARGSSFGNPTVLIAAAGNESHRELSPDNEVSVAPPANGEGFISVGALEAVRLNPFTLGVANFSNTGPNVSAPGVKIISCKLGGGLKMMSGTSMATPHVAGIAALWAEKLMREGALNSLLLTSKILGSANGRAMQDTYDPFDMGAGLIAAPQF